MIRHSCQLQEDPLQGDALLQSECSWVLVRTEYGQLVIIHTHLIMFNNIQNVLSADDIRTFVLLPIDEYFYVCQITTSAFLVPIATFLFYILSAWKYTDTVHNGRRKLISFSSSLGDGSARPLYYKLCMKMIILVATVLPCAWSIYARLHAKLKFSYWMMHEQAQELQPTENKQ